MTVEKDLEYHRQAIDLANKAESWLRNNNSIYALDHAAEPIQLHDFGSNINHVWYTQVLGGSDVKFGHIVMREGLKRSAIAAVSDFTLSNGVQWVLCGMSNHPASPDEPLASHVQTNNLVHEATHCIDFMRSGYNPRSFSAKDLNDVARDYYNKPHELNAYFHQGL